jgi:L-glyceraldehyde 3-phosphate reductase
MEYRKLGKSGLQVSEIALGSWIINHETFTACVEKAYELGVNHFDSANIYGDVPHSAEETLGQALSPFPRSSYVVTTKAWGPVGKGSNDRGLGRKHLLSEVEKSLRALKTDYIDIFYCHRFDPQTDLEETLRVLDDLVTQGKVLYIGFSEWNPQQIASAVGLQKQLGLRGFSASQPLYNLFDRSIEQEVIPMCDQYGIGQVVFSPLAQGILTGKYKQGGQVPVDSRVATFGKLFTLGLSSSERNANIKQLVTGYTSEEYQTTVNQLQDIALELGITLSQLALAWVLRSREVSSAVIGASKPEQIAENVQASGVRLDDEILAHIDGITK